MVTFMQGVTTAIVAFIFFCVIFPERVKNRPQFYAAFGLVCIIILLDAFAYMFMNSGMRVFCYFAIAVMQIGAICVLFLAAGGLSWRELAGDMSRAYEVIRRGGEKEVIVPLTGEIPKPREEAPRPRTNINPPPDDESRLPLE